MLSAQSLIVLALPVMAMAEVWSEAAPPPPPTWSTSSSIPGWTASTTTGWTSSTPKASGWSTSSTPSWSSSTPAAYPPPVYSSSKPYTSSACLSTKLYTETSYSTGYYTTSTITTVKTSTITCSAPAYSTPYTEAVYNLPSSKKGETYSSIYNAPSASAVYNAPPVSAVYNAPSVSAVSPVYPTVSTKVKPVVAASGYAVGTGAKTSPYAAQFTGAAANVGASVMAVAGAALAVVLA
jgi:hypothetical protein